MHPVEPLEHRTHFAATISLSSKGTLTVVCTSSADSINVGLLHNKPEDGFRALVTSGGTTQDRRFKFTSVKRIYIESAGGGDSIFIGGGAKQIRPATVIAGGGNDKINYTTGGAIFAAGGSGDDTVGATAIINVTSKKNSAVMQELFSKENTTAVHTLTGGAGNDTLSGDTNDVIDGGAGVDLGVIGVVSTDSLIESRRNALASLYYARLGAVSLEQTAGFDLLS